MNGPPLRRRVLLGAAVASVVSARLTLPAVAETGPKIEPIGELVSLPISPGRSASIPRVLGVAISGVDRLPKGVVVDFDFDPNLYDLMSAAVIQSGSHVERIPVPASRRAGPQRRTFSVTLPKEVPVAQVCAIWIGALKPRWFPYDSARLMPKGSYIIRGGSANGRRLEVGRSRSDRLWGVRLGCQWREIGLGHPYRTYVPEMITITSVGPSPAPPSLHVRLQLETALSPRLVGVAKISGSDEVRIGKLKNSPSGAEFDLIGSLSIGASVSISLKIALDKVECPHRLAPPIVEVVSNRAFVGQRVTGCESATRLDSIYDAETLLLWGNP